jgi:predicted 3-demethylubiquinone-9 3-methyltransferase (glyoxalase superfamily)
MVVWIRRPNLEERVQRVATSLMFVGDQYGKAEEAMDLYVSLFDDAAVTDVVRFGADDAESGLKRATFRLAGRELIAMDSGHAHPFSFTPAVSLMVECDDEQELDRLYDGLSEGATVLMPLQAYPFSSRFAWINDRYGVSWQLSLPVTM